MEIIAHRGSSFLAPENTLAAAELAWREGADVVEGDFRLTRDGQIVAMHDASLMRTAGIDRPVADCTLDELRTLDVGSWKSLQHVGQRIPPLGELLATVPSGKRFFIELKGAWEDLEPLKSAIKTSGLAGEQIVLICLQAGIVQQVKQVIPSCPALWVVDFKRTDSGAWIPSVDDVFLLANTMNVDGLDLMATGPIDAELVGRAKAANLDLAVWTVDDPGLARRLLNLGIEGITTNRPGWLRAQLATDHGTPTTGN